MIWIQAEDQELDQIKNEVNPSDYKRVEVEPKRASYLRKTMNKKEKEGYVGLLRKYSDAYAWAPSDLRGIPPDLGEHHMTWLMEQFWLSNDSIGWIQSTPSW